MTEAKLREAVSRVMPAVIDDLKQLCRIPSIAFDGFDHSHVERSAEAVAELLRGAGMPDVRIVRGTGQVDGRLFGRGCADDKAGVLAHVAALRAYGDDLPVGVVVFVEGEEEYGSESLEDLLRQHRDEVSADVIVIADSGNWDIGVPALTTSLRGLVNLFVDVRVIDHAVHSGMFGGAVPDALTVLARLLATLHDEAGEVAVAGLVSGPAAPLDYPVDRFRHEAGMLPGTELIGSGRLVERVWTKPAATVLGIDAPRT